MVLRLIMLAPIPVMILPRSNCPKVDDRNVAIEPREKIIRPIKRPRLRPNESERGPQIRTERAAETEYPVNRRPTVEDDLPTWVLIAGRSGLMIWLSATPMKRIAKRQNTTLSPPSVREDIGTYGKCLIRKCSAAISVKSTTEAAATPIAIVMASLISSGVAPNFFAFLI
jgi:hypothetical protein